MLTLSRLFIHPVKSMRGVHLSHAQALESGLAFDRIFMVTDLDGTFITARQYPEMVRFTPALLTDGLSLQAPDGSQAMIHFSDFAAQEAPTEVWGNHFTARIAPDAMVPESVPRLPKTIDFTVDYLRSGLPRDSYARARVVRSGRRYASVQVEAWQDRRARLFAQATGHFLMPQGS